MRWPYKSKPVIENGAERIVTVFLIFPLCVDWEWRWLELAKIRQKYHKAGSDSQGHWHGEWWSNERWVDRRKHNAER